jgi:hypothetical protein
MPQAQTGSKRSMPKVVRVNAADSDAIIYRNLGNGRRLPFIWGTSVTLASGTASGVISSGVSFSDHDVSGAKIFITPTNAASAAAAFYAYKDTAANVVSLKTVANVSDTATFDVMIMLGVGHNFVSTDSNQIWKKGAHNL